MKVNVEWKTENGWKSMHLPASLSKKGNMFVKYGGKVYVFPDLKEGTQVLTENRNQQTGEVNWTVAGRVTCGTVFLGEGMSYSEYSRTPEGVQDAKKLMESISEWRKNGV